MLCANVRHRIIKCRRARQRHLQVGDLVLFQDRHPGEQVSFPFQINPWKVSDIPETLVIAMKGEETVTRNTEFFKCYKPSSLSAEDDLRSSNMENVGRYGNLLDEAAITSPRPSTMQPSEVDVHKQAPALPKSCVMTLELPQMLIQPPGSRGKEMNNLRTTQQFSGKG
ncbi:hypothetical protein NDU88_007463 [Pleurodeles waltl]|uniref:Uncharacterized protein n=1 Tax=Pleurodeles waltl TaxID=8319 RepID=A0AAV7VUI6_PLEWA|nr:hypothetical protein NDU88_007463 [Pleurodeles waltl]